MQANSDGLSPSLRPFLGIGWNRALPAPFGFGNGIWPDGSNDYLKIPGLVGKTWPMEGCIEFWCSVQNSRAQREIEVTFSDNSNFRITAYLRTAPAIESAARNATAAEPPGTYSYGQKIHVAYMWDATKFYAWGSASPNLLDSQIITSNINLNITGVALCAQFDGSLCSSTKLDEVRFYNKKLKIDELLLNDNNGVGNNPNNTENLFAWFSFEQFESLDFSPLQDGTDFRIGIRDRSGQNNHALPFNMITDPSNSNYVLKPF